MKQPDDLRPAGKRWALRLMISYVEHCMYVDLYMDMILYVSMHVHEDIDRVAYIYIM